MVTPIDPYPTPNDALGNFTVRVYGPELLPGDEPSFDDLEDAVRYARRTYKASYVTGVDVIDAMGNIHKKLGGHLEHRSKNTKPQPPVIEPEGFGSW